jgi:hypothetical protein
MGICIHVYSMENPFNSGVKEGDKEIKWCSKILGTSPSYEVPRRNDELNTA